MVSKTYYSPNLLNEYLDPLRKGKGVLHINNSQIKTNEPTQKSVAHNYTKMIILALGCYYFGYFNAVFNPIGKSLGQVVYQINDDSKLNGFLGSLNSYFAFGGAFAVLISGPVSNHIGRVRLLILAEVVALSTFYLYTLKSITLLLSLRFVGGMIAGLNMNIGTAAIIEMFPTTISGFGGLFVYLSLTSFAVLGYLVNPFCGPIAQRDECVLNHWRLILAWPGAVSLLRLACLLIFFRFGLFESPKYFLGKKGLTALQVQSGLTNWFKNVYVAESVDELVRSRIESNGAKEAKPGVDEDEKEVGFKAVFSGKYRFRLLTAVTLNVLQQLSGVNFLCYYSTILFDQISQNGATMTLLVGFANMFGGLIGLFTIQKFGRRTNFLIPILLQTISFLALMIGKINYF